MTERANAFNIFTRFDPKAFSATSWAAIVVMVAILIRVAAPLTNDTEWLITNCRRFLDGAVLYRDIIETNPPMAILMHLPAALIERWTGLPAEVVFTVMVMAGALASGIFFSAILQLRRPGVPLLPVILAVLLIAPLNSFDQREHVALILTLPLIGVAVLRAEGCAPAWPILILAGALAGIAPMIKPFFALGIAAPYIALAILHKRVLALLAPEVLIAAALTLGSVVATWAVFPDYIHTVVPMLVELYGPMKHSLLQMVTSLSVLAWLVAVGAIYIAVRKDLFTSFNIILLSASAGYLVAFIEQGRGWAYHLYPALALLLIVAFVSVPQALSSAYRARRMAGAGAVAVASMLLLYASVFGTVGCGVADPIRAAVKKPTIMSITWDLGPGHPVTTLVHGRWIGTFASRWVTVNAAYLGRTSSDPARQKRYEAWLAYDRAITNHDLSQRPDIVLIGIGSPFDWHGWIARDAQTAYFMSDYVLLARDALQPSQRGRLEGVEAWIRKDLVISHHSEQR